jgi:tetratricopeptide (TPR) repeat protein
MQNAPLVELDDPFGPLPSFPIDDQSSAGRVRVVEAPPVSQAGARGAIDEDALEEIDFFTQHGMIDEARALLAEQLGRFPNHPLLLERQREIAAAAVDAPPTAPPPSSLADDRSFDIAASLGALDELEVRPPSRKPAPLLGEQVSVESVFEQFKAGVAAQVPTSDAATHYDLGAAYREMGLLDDAIKEFEIAARDPARECVCQWMIGMVHLSQNLIDEAIDAFIRGLQAGQRSPEQELALTYEVGNAYELRGSGENALYFFQQVAKMDPGYNDHRGSVIERIQRLSPSPKAPAKVAGANESLGDEFDRAFDDLFGKS